MKNKGFSLVELIVVVGIISLLAGVVTVTLVPVRAKARDTKRKAELSQMGRFFAATSCYLPDSGPGDYDLSQLYNELKTKYPQISNLGKLPRDPKSGNETISYYRYIVEDDRCALYANMENKNEDVTLTKINSPTAGGGNGVFRAEAAGPNGTNLYFQISK